MYANGENVGRGNRRRHTQGKQSILWKRKYIDGTFSGVLTDGNGVFAAMLISEGIEVITEKEKIEW